jgi:hypothetical protein
MLPIERNTKGRPEIRYTRIYRLMRRWQADGCMDAIFAGLVSRLHDDQLLDLKVIHGDGTTTAAKKAATISATAVTSISRATRSWPSVTGTATSSRHSYVRRATATNRRCCATPCAQTHPVAHAIGMDLQGLSVSLDGVYDCRANRKAIFNRGMVSNIPENPRGRKTPKRGRKQRFDPDIFEERFRTIERVFAWEDKFRRLLLRFERISHVHYAFKTLAYTMIVRHEVACRSCSHFNGGNHPCHRVHLGV